jgi:ABC-2 type transport system permease protein
VRKPTLKKSFTNFLRKNLAAARLAVLNQLEYRINYLIDAIVQPVLSTIIEVTLWMALLTGMGINSLGGFGREYYLSYALWASFVGRITSNWMYEYIMLDEIDSGRVNAILVRPISFFEFYFSQFLGYKLVTASFTFLLPLAVCVILKAPVHVERLPAMLLLVGYFLAFTYTVSFCVACMAFFMNRAFSLTAMKNMLFWAVSGELIPLDLFPEPVRTILMRLPFASGVYVPVAYITGRVGHDLLIQSFVSLTAGIAVMSGVGYVLWHKGMRTYTGTGA